MIKFYQEHMTIKLTYFLVFIFFMAVALTSVCYAITSESPTMPLEAPVSPPSAKVVQVPIETRVSPEKAKKALEFYLNEKNPDIVGCAGGIVEFERWVEAVAITRMETNFCTKGHGVTPKNNCGNISSSIPGRPNGRFKTYANKCDSIEDIAILLSTDRYIDLTIEAMNGTYCVDETTSKGGECPDWTEVSMQEVDAIRKLLSN